MIITKATTNDLDSIMPIIAMAKEYFRLNNINQWTSEYPAKEDFLTDINNDELFVIKDEDKVIGVFSLVNYEPSYSKIYEGQWGSNDNYIAIHRLAIDDKHKGKGVAKYVFDYLKEHFDCIRADTHRDNKAMINCLLNNGFTYRGIIYLKRDGDNKRSAYEYINDQK